MVSNKATADVLLLEIWNIGNSEDGISMAGTGKHALDSFV